MAQSEKVLKQIEINMDMGESFGCWKLGPGDEILFPLIDTCNAAAGFHASDPKTLGRTVKLAIESGGKNVGAHPGFNDKEGFGRRRMELSPQEVFDLMVYQIGAVKGFCEVNGIPLNHVKPHGALYFYLLSDKSICLAAVQAIAAFKVSMYGLKGTLHEQVAKELGVPFVPELFVDIEYSVEGALIPPSKSKYISPEDAAERVRKVVEQDLVPSQGDGPDAKMNFRQKDQRLPFSICLHSDLPDAEQRLLAVRKVVDELNAKYFC